MKSHFKASASPMHATPNSLADGPHHLAPELGGASHDHIHLQPGHMDGGGADNPMDGAAALSAGGASGSAAMPPAPPSLPPESSPGGGGGAPPGGDSEPDPGDPNEATEGESPMKPKKRGY